ncbi:MAG: ABC transporter substrate-binding protein [Caulobacteraceae bacterium]
MFTRTNLIALGVVVLATLAFWAYAAGHPNDGRDSTGPVLALDAPLPETVPSGTTVIIGDPASQWVIQHNGWDQGLPYTIQWAQISGGPAVTEAFHAKALDVGSSANIPPIHAVWVGIPVKTIAVRFRRDPINHPSFVFAVAPGSNIRTLADLRGRRIAFAAGQVQGEVVLKTLAAEGIPLSAVTLVELPSVGGDLYINALVGGEVDAAPIGAGAPSRKYEQKYGAQGGRLIRHSPFRDDLTNLYVRTETVQDPAKAAALRLYVQLWARAQAWIETHRDEFARGYYQGNQGLSADDAAYVVAAAGETEVPATWDEAVRLQQGSINLLAARNGQRRFDSAELFDRRFEAVAARAYAEALGSRR